MRRDLTAVEERIAEIEDRIQVLRAWIDRDRAQGYPTLISGSLLRSFEDTLSLERRRRIDLIAESGQRRPR